MGRPPVIFNNTKSVGGTAESSYASKKKKRVAHLSQYLVDIDTALNQNRGRRFQVKKKEENRTYSADRAAAKKLASCLRLCDEVRKILDGVSPEERDGPWIEKDAWEVEQRKLD